MSSLWFKKSGCWRTCQSRPIGAAESFRAFVAGQEIASFCEWSGFCGQQKICRFGWKLYDQLVVFDAIARWRPRTAQFFAENDDKLEWALSLHS
jgi:fructosamine-3-kinase